MFPGRVRGSPASSLPEADAGPEAVESTGSEQGWPPPAPYEAPLAPDGGPEAALAEPCPAEPDAPSAAVRSNEPLRVGLQEVLRDHQRALREAAARHEAGMRRGADAVLEALGRDLAGLLRSRVVLQEPAGCGEDGELPARLSERWARREVPVQRRSSRSSSVGSKALELADTEETRCSTSERPGKSRPRPAARAPKGWPGAPSVSTDFDAPTRKTLSRDITRDVLSGSWSLTPSGHGNFDTVWSQLPARVNRLAESFAGVCFARRDEQMRKGVIAGIVGSMTFALVGNLVIFVNSALIVYAANRRVYEDSDSTSLMIAELAFTGWYILELVLKLFVHRCSYFTGEDRGFNVVDLVLVILSTLEALLWVFGEWGMVGVDSSFLRTLRVFKVAKVLRMFRALRMFDEIRLMMECVVQSMGSLFWAITLLSFLNSLFAIFFVQSVGNALDQSSLTAPEAEALLRHFGSVQAAMFTLLQATSGGLDWMIIYERLTPLGVMAQSVFVFYIMLMLIAVMNIVASVYLDKAMQVAKPTLENMMLDKHYQDMKDAKELTDLVSEMDTQDSGVITFSDFMRYMKEDKFRLYFDVRGLNVKDTTMFFKMLSSASKNGETDGRNKKEDTVDLKAFVMGCMRLKGVASCMDLYTVSWEIKILRAQQSRLMECLGGHLAEPPTRPRGGRGGSPHAGRTASA